MMITLWSTAVLLLLTSSTLGTEQPAVTESRGADSGEKGLDGVTNAPNVARLTTTTPPRGADSGEKALNQPVSTKPPKDSQQQNEDSYDSKDNRMDDMGGNQKQKDSRDNPAPAEDSGENQRRRDSNIPTHWPTRKPTLRPTFWPTRKPTPWPTAKPTRKPTQWPTPWPTDKPTRHPTNRPTSWPTEKPTRHPTRRPTSWPTEKPTRNPTRKPTQWPTAWPTDKPTRNPTRRPTKKPTRKPTRKPTEWPTVSPTREPTAYPTLKHQWHAPKRWTQRHHEWKSDSSSDHLVQVNVYADDSSSDEKESGWDHDYDYGWSKEDYDSDHDSSGHSNHWQHDIWDREDHDNWHKEHGDYSHDDDSNRQWQNQGTYKWNDGRDDDHWERVDEGHEDYDKFVEHNVFHEKHDSKESESRGMGHDSHESHDDEHHRQDGHSEESHHEKQSESDSIQDRIRTWQELEPQLHAIFGEADRGVNEGQHQEAEGDGKVSFQEVVKNVPEVKDQPDHRAMFDYVDGDNDRYITFEEFKKFMYNEVMYHSHYDEYTKEQPYHSHSDSGEHRYDESNESHGADSGEKGFDVTDIPLEKCPLNCPDGSVCIETDNGFECRAPLDVDTVDTVDTQGAAEGEKAQNGQNEVNDIRPEGDGQGAAEGEKGQQVTVGPVGNEEGHKASDSYDDSMGGNQDNDKNSDSYDSPDEECPLNCPDGTVCIVTDIGFECRVALDQNVATNQPGNGPQEQDGPVEGHKAQQTTRGPGQNGEDHKPENVDDSYESDSAADECPLNCPDGNVCIATDTGFECRVALQEVVSDSPATNQEDNGQQGGNDKEDDRHLEQPMGGMSYSSDSKDDNRAPVVDTHGADSGEKGFAVTDIPVEICPLNCPDGSVCIETENGFECRAPLVERVTTNQPNNGPQEQPAENVQCPLNCPDGTVCIATDVRDVGFECKQPQNVAVTTRQPGNGPKDQAEANQVNQPDQGGGDGGNNNGHSVGQSNDAKRDSYESSDDKQAPKVVADTQGADSGEKGFAVTDIPLEKCPLNCPDGSVCIETENGFECRAPLVERVTTNQPNVDTQGAAEGEKGVDVAPNGNEGEGKDGQQENNERAPNTTERPEKVRDEADGNNAAPANQANQDGPGDDSYESDSAANECPLNCPDGNVCVATDTGFECRAALEEVVADGGGEQGNNGNTPAPDNNEREDNKPEKAGKQQREENANAAYPTTKAPKEEKTRDVEPDVNDESQGAESGEKGEVFQVTGPPP